MSTSLFLKVWAQDYEFMKYCLRSVVRFASGFDSVVVVSDADAGKPPVGTMEKWFQIPRKENGYCWQQCCKVNADAFTNSENIVFLDADTIFTKPITPESIMIGGLPVWLYESYSGMDNPDVLARRVVMEQFVGAPVEFEFMRRHPFIITRELLADFRRFCWMKHGIPAEEFIMTKERVSEFNMLGCWAWEHHRSAIAWRRPEEMPTYVLQMWSHGPGLTDSIRAEFEEKLK